MPELPEVETIARGLRAVLAGRTIRAVEVCWEGAVAAPEPAEFARRLRGSRVGAVARRGKWLRIDLEGGGALLLHLRMTGRLLTRRDPADDPHTRIVLTLDNGLTVRFCDARKFGRMLLTDDPQRVLGALGPVSYTHLTLPTKRIV